VTAPVGDFFQAFSASVLEQSDFVAAVFELVNVGPHLGLPRPLVGFGRPATGAPGMKRDTRLRRTLALRQFDEDASYFFDLVGGAENVLVAQKVAKAEFSSFDFGFFARVKRPIFGSQLFSRVAGHPENVFISHSFLSLRAEQLKFRAVEPVKTGRYIHRTKRVHWQFSNWLADIAATAGILQGYRAVPKFVGYRADNR
jgi:hypothetical protein